MVEESYLGNVLILSIFLNSAIDDIPSSMYRVSSFFLFVSRCFDKIKHVRQVGPSVGQSV